MVELWEKLLAAAMHPDRRYRVRAKHVEILKQLEPLDSVFLSKTREFLVDSSTSMEFQQLRVILTPPGVSEDEAAVSLNNLIDLNLLKTSTYNSVHLTSYGTLFLSVVE